MAMTFHKAKRVGAVIALLAGAVTPSLAAAKVRGAVISIIPMRDGAAVFVVAAMKCYLLQVDSIVAADKGPEEDRPLADGYPCSVAATNGEDAAATINNGTFAISNPLENSGDLAGGYLLTNRETDPQGGPRKAKRPFTDAKVMRFPSDGRSLAIGDAMGRISVLSLPDGGNHEIDRLSAPIEDIRFVSGDGAVLAVDRAGRFGVWDWQSERPAETGFPESLRVRAITTAAEAPVAGIWGQDGKIRIFSTEDWALKATLSPGAAAPSAFEISRKGRLLAYAASNTAAVLDAESGAARGYLPMDPATVRALAFLPKDRRLVVGTSDGRLKVLEIPADLQERPWLAPEPMAKSARRHGTPGPQISPLGGPPTIPPPMGLPPTALPAGAPSLSTGTRTPPMP